MSQGNIVYAYQIDGKWGSYVSMKDIASGENASEAKKTYFTDDTSTWVGIPTIQSDIDDLYSKVHGDSGGNVSICADEDNCFLVDLNNAKNRDNIGKHHITFFVYYWVKATDKGSAIYRYDFDTTFDNGQYIENDNGDLSVSVNPINLTSLKAEYSFNFSSAKSKLSDYVVSLADGSDDELYDYKDDCKGLSTFSTKYTFLQNGTYALIVSDDDGNLKYLEITISNITGKDDGKNNNNGTTLPTTNVAAPSLSVSGVPSANSVQLGNTVNIVVSSNMNCTISGDGIQNPVKGTSVTVPIDTNGVYEFYGTLDDGTYGRTSVTIDCFADESSGSNQAQSTGSSKTYSSLEDFWGSQLDDKLPQTGTIGLSSVLGLGLAGMASGLVLMRKKKKDIGSAEKEDEDNEK